MKIYSTKFFFLASVFIFFTLLLHSQSFVEQTTIVMPGVSQSSVAWGDFNNDGNPDLLISGSSAGYMTKLYKNNGNGSFTEMTSVSLTGIFAGSSAWGDYNNDGFLDILLTGYSNSGKVAEIYLNNGNSTFTKQTGILLTGVQISTSGWCDYNNDGYVDILLTGESTFGYIAKLYKNSGPPSFTFTEQTNIALQGIINGSVAWSDYDKDGLPDILLSGFTGSSFVSKIYRNNGDNTFTDKTEISLPGVRYGSVEWGDYDSDGFPDILLTGQAGSDCVSKIYKNNKNGSFTEQTGIILFPVKNSSAAWGDYDNDGRPDILLTGDDINNIPVSKVYHNNGNNTFTEQTGISLANISQGTASWIDYDNDSDLDILITGYTGTVPVTKFYRNDIIAKNTVPGSPAGFNSSVAGMNVTLNWGASSDGQTPAAGLSYNLRVGSSAGASDIVNPNSLPSGKSKLAVTGNMNYDNSYLLKNLKKGTYFWSVQAIDNCFAGGPFAAEQTFTITSEIQASALTLSKSEGKRLTINWNHGSGQKRIVCAKEGTGGTAVPVNNISYTGNAAFGSGTQVGSGWYCVYNGNGNDLVISGLKSLTSYTIQVIEYQGAAGSENYFSASGQGNPGVFQTSVFTEQTGISIPAVVNSSVAWGDYDNDGDLDILLTGDSTGVPIARIIRNDGGNNFVPQYNIKLPGVESSSAVWNDFNNDGKLDLLLTGWSASGCLSVIYKNNGGGSFTEQTSFTLDGVVFGSLACADYDNDGYTDILLTGSGKTGNLISKIYRNTGNSFSEQSSIQITGVYYSSVAWSDYDKDGYPDFLVTGFACPNYSCPVSKIYRNNGDGSFTEQTGITLTGIGWSSAAWGDYNNDGYPDILLSGYSDNNPNYISRVYKNNGNGTFSVNCDIMSADKSSGKAAWGDYDNDGYIDILITVYAQNKPFTKVYRNNHNGAFEEQTAFSLTGITSGSVNWGDYNNDGNLDIILTGNSPDGVQGKLFRNDIQAPNSKPAAPDGLIEVLPVNENIILKWKPVKTDETYFPGLTYNLKVGKTSGGSELISPLSLASGFRIVPLEGNCRYDTAWQIKNTPGNYFWSVQAVDNSFQGGPFSVQRTFTIDSIQAKGLSAKIIDSTTLLVKWKRGNGQRCVVFCKSGPKSSASPSDNSNYIADNTFRFGDQIGNTEWYTIYNGRNDSVILSGLKPNTEYSIEVVEYLGQNGSEKYYRETNDNNLGNFGTGLFTKLPGPVISAQGSVAWGDYNNDGYLDILFAGWPPNTGYATKIFRNNGNAGFTEVPGLTLTGVTNCSIAWGDFNNDGYLDILLSGWAGSDAITQIYKNDGPPSYTFSLQPYSLTGVNTGTVSWQDYNNDGYLDILITGGNTTGLYSKIYKNSGAPDFTFNEQTSIPLPAVFNSSVAWADYNNDGYPDLLLSGFTNASFITEIFKNNGDNTFSELATVSLPGVRYGSLSWADYDNDGYPDILLTGQATTGCISKIFKNNGGITFTEQTGIKLTGVYNGSSSWGDYDGDGNLDIILTGYTSDSKSVSKIYHNNGNSTFTELKSISLTNIYQSSVSWADYDNDGDLDILASGTSVSGVESVVYRNNSIIKSGAYSPNLKPAKPTLLSHTLLPDKVKLEWNPVSNDETPPGSLSYNLRYRKSGELNWRESPQSSETGFRRIVSMGNLQLNSAFNIGNLTQGKYAWQIQAVDQGYQGGEWSVADTFEVKNVQAFFKADTVCLGIQTHFTDQSVATDGIASWKWNFNDGTISSLQSPVHLFTSGGTKHVKLVIKSSEGAMDSLEKEVIIKPRPSTEFSALTTCQGTPVTITNTTNNNGLTINAWKWNFGDAQISDFFQPPPHGYLSAGDYVIKLSATASNGCADSVINIVTVSAFPAAIISASTPLSFCKGDSVVLSVQNNPDYLYDWRADGTSITGAASYTYPARLNGNYSVVVINKKGNCTSSSSAVTVTALNAPAPPHILIAGALEFCKEDSVMLNVTNTPGTLYQWKLNGGAIGLNENKITAKDGGIYNVVVSNSTGCSASSADSVKVIVKSLPAAGVISLSGPASFCEGGSVTLSTTSVSDNIYSWRNENGVIAGANSTIFFADKTGKYQVDISNPAGCTVTTLPVEVTARKAPVKPLIVSDNYTPGQCPWETAVQLSISQAISGYSYQWKKDNDPIVNATSSTYEISGIPGKYTVEAGLNGCNSLSETFNVNFDIAPDKPEIYAKGPTVWMLTCKNDSVKHYKWYFNSTLIEGADKYFYIANQKLGQYYVTIGNSNLCFTKSNVITIPTGITGIKDIDPFAGLKIYPNPTPGVFTIEMDNNLFGELNIRISNQNGSDVLKIKFEKSVEHFSSQIDLSGQWKGMYLINLTIDKYQANRKIVVN